MVTCIFSGLSDPGLLRTSNQDDYHIDPDGRFFIVADGMGGHAGGQEASRLATTTIKNFLEQNWHSETATATLLELALKQANNDILDDQHQHPERSDMGTTVVVVTFRESDSAPWCAHVGDSRLYRLRGHHLAQLTEDHTWIAKAIRAGEVTPAQSRNHPWRHVLSQCLGRDDLTEIGIQSLDVNSGDRLLLCSDGLTE
ncbi:MAG: protein phosphatase 2C domain-containing protein, partial [Cyanobacteria bacterium J06638_6]